MTAWKEVHYARAQEFTRVIADLTAPFRSPAETRSTSAASPVPAAPPVASAPAPKTTGTPTAASMFKRIPWKK